MAEYVDFHYLPLEGKISGESMLKQTEDAINDLGEKVYSIDVDASDIQQALDNSEQAIDTANTALATVTTNRAVWFNNVANMVDANLDVGVVAATKGYYLAGDGGSGFYIIRTAVSGDADDGGSIIFLDNGAVAELIMHGTVNVKQFGAKGDGTTDDTTAIQNAFEKFHDIYIPDGTYMINSRCEGWSDINGESGGVYARDNSTITLSSNAVLKSITNKTGFYKVINVRNATNVTIRGGKVLGDTTTPTEGGLGGEYGYGIALYNSTHVTIDNVESTGHWGDGIFCSGTYGVNFNAYATIKKCHLHHNRRQGISIVAGSEYLVKDCYIHDIEGVAPQSCIDVEGNADNHIENVRIINCVFENGDRKELSISTSADNIYVDNCIMNYLLVPKDDQYPTKNIVVNNSVVRKSLSLLDGNITANDCKIGSVSFTFNSINAWFSNCKFDSCYTNQGEVIAVATGTSTQYINANFANCVFDLPTLKNTEDNARDFINVSYGTTDKPISVVFDGCKINTKKRSYVVGPNFGSTIKMEIVNSVLNTDVNPSNFFLRPAWLEIKKSEFNFANSGSVGRFVAVNTTNSVHFVYDGNIMNGKINSLLYNNSTTGFSSAFSVVVNNNIYNNPTATTYATVGGGGSANVTVVGGNNYGVTLS